ncbi:hypothetical protein H8959_015497, partial [Pygathrix nigripes]
MIAVTRAAPVPLRSRCPARGRGLCGGSAARFVTAAAAATPPARLAALSSEAASAPRAVLDRDSRKVRTGSFEEWHPWSRMIVAYLVIFFNFLIFAEDPVSHSQTEANVIVVGNCFSFVTNKYPRGVGWRILKVLLWLLAILTGLIAGKFLFHQRLFGQLLRLKMFREDHGSWMTMFFSTILFLFIFSHIYNTILLMDGNMG